MISDYCGLGHRQRWALQLLAIPSLALALSLAAGCNLTSAPGQPPTAEQNTTSSVAGSEREGACVPATGLSNLTLQGTSPEALSYLQRYSIPTSNETEFCQYLAQLQSEHAAKIDEGLFDMMGDYFWTTQSVETNYFFSYKLGGREDRTPQIILDRTASEDEMVERFMAAIDQDPDPKRKALLDATIHQLSEQDNLTRPEGVRRLMNVIFEKSWVFDAEFQQAARGGGRDDTYNFVERGLRTTTPIIAAALVDRVINSDAAKQILPDKITKVLIIGPGLQFSDPNMGPALPQQSHEPFTLTDSLLRSGKANLDDLRIDLLDINPRVVEHFEDATKDPEPYVVRIVMNTEEDRGRAQLGVFDYGRSILGSSIPGAESSAPVPGRSLRPSSGTLEPAEMLVRTLEIPPNVVSRLHAFSGDMTTTDLEQLSLEDGKKYDAIFCFNTLVYLDETERMLAGINIREALAENGVFVTDNRFDTDSGARPDQPENEGESVRPIFDPSFLYMAADFNEDGSDMAPVESEGRRTIIYRSGGDVER